MTTALPLLPLTVDGLSSAWLRMLAQEGVPTTPFNAQAPAGRFVLYDGRRRSAPALCEGLRSIDVSLFEFDVRPVEISAESAPQICRAFWQVGPLEVSEEVAAIDHRAVRETLMGRLRQAVCEVGGVWLRTSPYPWPYRTAANFRFDHDRCLTGDLQRTLDAIAGHEYMTTHFVCAAAHERHPSVMARLRGLEIGSHGYRHHTYVSGAENEANLARGIQTLGRFGIEPSGFVSPCGRYNPGLAAALARLAISHSSEFTAAYDDLPFAPEGSSTLQIPVHPVCLGIALEAGRAAGLPGRDVAEWVGDYFADSVREKYAAGEPLFFYGHPDGRIGRHPQVLRRWFAAVDELSDVWRTGYTQFAHWWRERTTCRWSVCGTAERPEICCGRTPGAFPAAVEWFHGERSALVPLQAGRTTLDARRCRFEIRGLTRRSRPHRIERLRGLRGRLHRLLDWEYETPLHEIDAGHWRGWVKRSLRVWKEAFA